MYFVATSILLALTQTDAEPTHKVARLFTALGVGTLYGMRAFGGWTDCPNPHIYGNLKVPEGVV